MEKFIISYLNNTYFSYIKINDELSIKKIYDMFDLGIIPNCVSDIEYMYTGIYYQILRNYDEMIKCYLTAIEKGSIKSMYYLGYYYSHIENNYEKMKKYYLMAIEK